MVLDRREEIVWAIMSTRLKWDDSIPLPRPILVRLVRTRPHPGDNQMRNCINNGR